MNLLQFVYPFTNWRIFWFLPIFAVLNKVAIRILMQVKMRIFRISSIFVVFLWIHIYVVFLISKIFHIHVHGEAICEVIYDILIFPLHFFTDIQEFYEMTLLNSQKSCEQKIEEANQVAQKWEKTSLLAPCHDNLQKSVEVYYWNF